MIAASRPILVIILMTFFAFKSACLCSETYQPDMQIVEKINMDKTIKTNF
jgi:hypothetical protein